MKSRRLETMSIVLAGLLLVIFIIALISKSSITILLLLCIVLILNIIVVGLAIKQRKKLTQQADEIAKLNQQFIVQQNEESQMLANVSHEMRTPLTTIMGITEGLQYGVMEGNEQRSYDLIKEEADRLTRLVKSILSYERMRQGAVVSQPENFNVTALISELAEKMWSHATMDGNEIQNLCEQDVYIYADRDQVERILINILANALQFTKNGIISVSATVIDNQAHIKIADTGIGMTKEQIDKIWQRYYKVDPSRTRKGESGLGMAIVHELIDANHGTVTVSSKVGVGTTFEVVLPQESK